VQKEDLLFEISFRLLNDSKYPLTLKEKLSVNYQIIKSPAIAFTDSFRIVIEFRKYNIFFNISYSHLKNKNIEQIVDLYQSTFNTNVRELLRKSNSNMFLEYSL